MRRGTGKGLWRRGLARLLHVAMVLFGFHTAGVLHAALDVVDAFEEHAGRHDLDCEEEGCPPACPTCHCPQRGVMPPAPGAAGQIIAFLSFGEVLPLSEEDFVHESPILGTVYRPPRRLSGSPAGA